MKFNPIFSDNFSENFTPPSGMVAVYALLDDDNTIRYVGKTMHRVGDRRTAHLNYSTATRTYYSKTSLWLRTRATPPRVTVIGLAYDTEWTPLEQAWIRDLRLEDDDLTNTAVGGEGCGGWKHTAETKERISQANKGRKRSQESIERTAAAHRGRKRSPETGQRISAAKTGKSWSTAQRAAREAAIKGEVYCVCRAGPFQGSWGLLQHRRQMHEK